MDFNWNLERVEIPDSLKNVDYALRVMAVVPGMVICGEGGLVGWAVAGWVGALIGGLIGAAIAAGLLMVAGSYYRQICQFFRMYER